MIAGIVCEYNPFHNGHLYHIEKTRQAGADYIVCVMSGNFVQRGECAVADKWVRAKAAVLCGADIVIDLPTPWSCNSAESFARGSVGLLMNFGIDVLSFGCESDDRDLLIKCANSAENADIALIVKGEIAKGATYPAAMQTAMSRLYGENYAKAVASPNNTLAIEYIKQLKLYGKEGCILPIKRQGASHDSCEAKGNIASASMIRNMGLDSGLPFMPPKSSELFAEAIEKGFAPCFAENNETGILSVLRSIKKEDYSLYVSDNSGLASRIYEAVKTAGSLEALYEKAKSKNYTMSRVRREVMNLYLGINKHWSEGIPPYMKILAANEKGLSLLSNAKKNSRLPIITRHAEADSLTLKARQIYEAECKNTDLFALMSKKIRVCSLEETHSVQIVR